MANQKISVIVNPKSSGGAVGKNWKNIESKIKEYFPNMEATFTQAKGEAIVLSEKAVNSGCRHLIIVGGDGTVSETVNGVMQSGKNKDVHISIINSGTGGDFCKTIGVPGDIKLALDNIKKGIVKSVDTGFVKYIDYDRKNQEKYFINIVGCGMAGEVVRSVNHSSKKFGGFSYYLGGVSNLLKYKNKNVVITLDGQKKIERRIVTAAICNGQFFGGGMQIAPQAGLDDGLFHLTLLNDWSLFKKIFYSKNLYNGTIYQTPGVENFQCKHIKIVPAEKEIKDTFIDCDGEDIGYIPMEVELKPKAIQFIV